MYNEDSHCERVIKAACKVAWPRDKLLVQVRKPPGTCHFLAALVCACTTAACAHVCGHVCPRFSSSNVWAYTLLVLVYIGAHIDLGLVYSLVRLMMTLPVRTSSAAWTPQPLTCVP